jgi:hypothetical protein
MRSRVARPKLIGIQSDNLHMFEYVDKVSGLKMKNKTYIICWTVVLSAGTPVIASQIYRYLYCKFRYGQSNIIKGPSGIREAFVKLNIR